MPKATTSPSDTERFELKSCPEGYVILRRMTYGQMLQRRAMSMGMTFASQGKGKQAEFQGAMQLANAKVTEFEFQNCIADHNLEDEEGNKLNFAASIPSNLHPQIGEEIGQLIDEMNQFDAEGN